MSNLKYCWSVEGSGHSIVMAWVEGTREAVRQGAGPDVLHEDHVRNRFGLSQARHVDGDRPYRPKALSKHTTWLNFYK